MISPDSVGPSSFLRHLVFILINTGGALLLFWNQAKPLLLTPLILQQLWSHAEYGRMVCVQQNRIDWAAFYIWEQNNSK